LACTKIVQTVNIAPKNTANQRLNPRLWFTAFMKTPFKSSGLTRKLEGASVMQLSQKCKYLHV
jgi:hypothetical protein